MKTKAELSAQTISSIYENTNEEISATNVQTLILDIIDSMATQDNLLWTSGSTGSFSTKANNDSGLDATGNYAIAEGEATLASGEAAHAEGWFSTASGVYSHSEGYKTTTNSGYGAHAEGYFTVTSGDSAHAEGQNTNAIGIGSHTEGGYSTAIGDYSHTEGYGTTASNYASHAGGMNSIATGLLSFIHSTNSTVSGDRSVVLGGQNITGTNADTVYVPFLNINNVGSTTPIINLGLDANGFVVTGTTGGGTFTGGTVTGATNFTNGLTSNSISATTYLNLPIDISVTGGSYNSSTGIETFTNNTGGTFTVTGLNIQPNYFPITGGTISGSINVTGNATVQGNVTILGSATTIYSQHLYAEDNNIFMNYSGTHLTANGGGIVILSGVSNSQDATWTIDGSGNWSANTAVYAPSVSATSVTGYSYALPDTSIPASVPSGQLILASYNQQGFSVPHVYDTQGNKIEITRDNLLVARNVTGSAMTKGQVVYISGATGTVPQIILAKANAIATLGIIGVCYENISNNSFGRVMTLGDLESIDMSAFANGDTLYVSPTTAGALTNVKPTYPNFAQQVGYVINNGVGSGVLGVYIRGIVGVYNGDNAVLNSVTATTISATTYQNLPSVYKSGTTGTTTAVTINTDNYNIYNITGLTSGITITLTGTTQFDGQPLTVLVKDAGVSQTLTFGPNFNFSTYLPAPTSTTANKIMKIYSTYSVINSKWNVDNWQDGY